MDRLTEILCPVDLSEQSGHALDHAFALARSYSAHLTVMEVTWPGLPPYSYPGAAGLAMPPVPLPGQLDALREGLRVFTDRGIAAGVRMDLVVREGAVVPTILEEARTIGADLIVMGTHGRSGFDRLLLGSVTEKVLRKAECAVMTVPPADRTAAPARAVRTIVCAIDFSPASHKALAHAFSLAQELHATLLLMHVIDWPPERPMSRTAELDTDASRAAARVGLRALVSDDARARCQTEQYVTIGRPHEEIVRCAHERDADLIVMGVHGRSALNVALFGSTTNQVVRHADCPVITVRG